MLTLPGVAAHLDSLLRVADVPDYPNAINGVQFTNRGSVIGVATAVDASLLTIQGTVDCGANLLVVHHGLFWGGAQPVAGYRRERIRLLLKHDISVYSVHLPLDAHAEFGNSRLLATQLSLQVLGGFAHLQGVACGVHGNSGLPTSSLLASVDQFAKTHGGAALASRFDASRRTNHWAICSGAGASAETLDEAVALGIDTLIVGEGPHWSAVEAPERGLVIIYAGHYATETLGVIAIGGHLATVYGIPHSFIPAPTGL